MKALSWQSVLERMEKQHSKVFYTVLELQVLCGADRHATHLQISRLVDQEILQRYDHGIYGRPNARDLAQLLPLIDSCAYLTGMSALLRHELITQIPTSHDCFTARDRRKRVSDTPLGKIVFHRVTPPIYHYNEAVAPAEQALCDFVYMSRRSGVQSVLGLVTFRKLHELDMAKMERTLANYPASVRSAIDELLSVYHK